MVADGLHERRAPWGAEEAHEGGLDGQAAFGRVLCERRVDASHLEVGGDDDIVEQLVEAARGLLLFTPVG
jgi:hypothetical protein